MNDIFEDEVAEQDGDKDTEAPPAAPAADWPRLRQVLGRVSAEGVKIVGKPAANNTRWVFDVGVSPDRGEDITVLLTDYRSGRVLEPDLMSFSVTPTNRLAYDVKPVLYDDHGALRICTESVERSSGYATFRVAVDVMHSATR